MSPPITNVNIESVEAVVAELWNDLKKYTETATALAVKNSELAFKA